jgi:hypothetical protein
MNFMGIFCCAYVVIDFKLIMNMVNYSTITYIRSHESMKIELHGRMKGSTVQKRISGVEGMAHRQRK